MEAPATIRVQVRLNGPLAARLGNRPTLDLPAPATVADLLRALGDGSTGCAVHVDGRIAPPDTPVTEGVEMAVLVPYAGG
jgi:sulfur carrier protein ThiS